VAECRGPAGVGPVWKAPLLPADDDSKAAREALRALSTRYGRPEKGAPVRRQFRNRTGVS
jgi:hypothetical protein